MNSTVFIYALKEPDTGAIRYIGKSHNPDRRLRGHLKEVKRRANHRTNWIKSLLSRGLLPVLEVIDEVSVLEWEALESAYIHFYREEGCKLVNATNGGDGLPLTPEICAKISLALRRNKNALGYKHTELARKKMSAHKHAPFSAEVRERIGAARRGKPRPEEVRAKIRASLTGRVRGPLSPEWRAKISESLRSSKANTSTV